MICVVGDLFDNGVVFVNLICDVDVLSVFFVVVCFGMCC